MSNESRVLNFMAGGWITQDVDEIFVGDKVNYIENRRYYVQLTGEITSKAYWSEPTTFSPQRFLRETLKDYPEAMILKTRYV